ncbi:MAG: succinate dehydrogenase assembly factor 2 [Gammaproteobacteria bacterium]
MVVDSERARLRWQCRRGMRELDLLLEDFMCEQYDSLGKEERQAFRRLLDCPDQLLLEYLMGRMAPSDKEVAYVVARIRRPAAH